jgi:hypothetical protein
MEQSPSCEANRVVAGQEILLILLNPKDHYHIHNWPPPVSILNQSNPVHIPHIVKIYLNIILPTTPGFPKNSLSLMIPRKTHTHVSLLPIRATCHANLNPFYFITGTILGEEYREATTYIKNKTRDECPFTLSGYEPAAAEK